MVVNIKSTKYKNTYLNLRSNKKMLRQKLRKIPINSNKWRTVSVSFLPPLPKIVQLSNNNRQGRA